MWIWNVFLPSWYHAKIDRIDLADRQLVSPKNILQLNGCINLFVFVLFQGLKSESFVFIERKVNWLSTSSPQWIRCELKNLILLLRFTLYCLKFITMSFLPSNIMGFALVFWFRVAYRRSWDNQNSEIRALRELSRTLVKYLEYEVGWH